MSIGEVQMRIATIQTQVATLHAAAAGAVAKTAAPATTATPAASGVQFAAALDSAVAAQKTTASGWTKPVEGRISSHYGMRGGEMHGGLDIAAAKGSPVRAAADGIIRKASWYGGYGNAVIIDHGNGVTTLYGHNSALEVREGQKVKAGELIAKAGSTGDSSGPHVHMEVKVNGKKVDPEPWLKQRGISW